MSGLCTCPHLLSWHWTDGCRWGNCKCDYRTSLGTEAPAPISSEAGAVSAIADHSSDESVPSTPDGVASPSDIDATVEAAAAAEPSYRDLAIIGLVEHIADLHRSLGDLQGAECPFINQVLRQMTEPRTLGENLRIERYNR